MRRLKSRGWKDALVVLISGLFNIIIHGLISPLNSSDISLLKPSIFVESGMLIPAIIVWELLTFSIFTVVFILIENKLPWKKIVKGLFYGFSFAMLYFIGMFESALLTNGSMFNELLMGAGDFFTFLLYGFLLGIFIGRPQVQDRKRSSISSIFAVALFYFIGRYFAYAVLRIQSAYITQPAGTLIWTLCQALWVGMIFYILQSGAAGNSVLSWATFFGVVVFGANWFANHLFIALIAEFSPDIFIRAGVDIISTTTGIYVYRKFSLINYKTSSVIHNP